MAFKRDLSPTYRWPIVMPMIGETGEYIEFKFHVRFARISQSALEKLITDTQSGAVSDGQFVRMVVKGWDGYFGDDEKEIPFSDTELTALTDLVGMRSAIVQSFFESIREGPGKNLKQQPTDGPTLPAVTH